MHIALLPILAVFSALTPARQWVPPTQPIVINVKVQEPSKLVLTDFAGKEIAPKDANLLSVSGEKSVNLKDAYKEVSKGGTYVLFVVPQNKPTAQFTGTPLVIDGRSDNRKGAGGEVMVTKIDPLEYAVMTTEQGTMSMAMYYDVAPISVSSFLYLSRTGYYDGLTFHRIIPDFVIQGGDPMGTGTGGPGYNVQAEFNDRKHEPGVLSMARQGDPMERSGAAPRCEFANSAGSQFFVCLNYQNTQSLDGKYTAFGKVIDGMDTVKKIASVPLATTSRGQSDKPANPPVIQKVEVKPVTAAENPYAEMFGLKK